MFLIEELGQLFAPVYHLHLHLVASGKVASVRTGYHNSGGLGTEKNTTAGIFSLSFENFFDIFTLEQCSM